MTKVLTVVGARPQFVKAAALSRALKTHGVDEVIVHTGQHFDKNMSEVFFEEMKIPHPDYNLEIHSLNHGAMTGRMLEGIEEILLKEKPDVLLVYGDTNSTIAGALAASKLHIKVAHVEAGLRSFNMKMPEEVNRILTDRISDFLFCPTDTAIENLKKEGFENMANEIIKSGDVMQDAAYFYAKESAQRSTVIGELPFDEFLLATLHRAENTDDPEKLGNLVSGLNHIHQNIKPVVLPLHPRTKKKLSEHGLDLKVHTIEPVGYFDMIELISNSSLVLTDSGGLQKEAFFFKRPCVTMREQTEWVELVEHGVNTLVGSDDKALIDAVSSMLKGSFDFEKDLYGNGQAADRIAEFLKERLG